MGGSAPRERYDAASIALHWITALLVVGLWLAGISIDGFPKGPARTAARSAHIAAGLVLFVVVAARIAWRFTGARRPPPAGTGLAARIAPRVHALLYVLLAAVVTAGLVTAWVRGETVFGWWTFTSPDPGNRPLRKGATNVHEVLAHTLAAVALLHAAAAVWHQRVLRDGLLSRMLPRGRGASGR